MTMLRVENTTTAYGSHRVLHDVSFDVAEGEYVAILGANGHGKSTLLKTICGLLRPLSGTISLFGEDITGKRARSVVAAGLVYVPEDMHLFREMTVRDNLRAAVVTRDARRHEKEQLAYCFALFPALERLVTHPAGALSGGQARMLTLARGLMSGATCLAIDEPSRGLSPKLREAVFDRIGEINRSGKTILLVEQDVAEVLPRVERILAMENGRIVFDGQRDAATTNSVIREAYLGM